LHEIRVKDVNRLEKNENENAARTLILTSLAAADGNPDDIKNNQEKGALHVRVEGHEIS